MPNPPGKFQILALDGGGIKGLFSAAILAHIERDFSIRIQDHFDLITGTSTGGIIALGLGKGLSPKEIVEFYIEEGPRIFPCSRLGSVRHYFSCKYSIVNLKKCLKECFGDTLLGNSERPLVIPSYSISEDDVYLFKTPHNDRLRRDWKVEMWKVAMATSAAPTYFSAFTGVDRIRLIDGGVWANNPTMVGVVEAVNLLNVPTESIRVFNIGTTDSVKGRSGKLDNGGKWQWKSEVVDVILRGQSRGAYTHAGLLLGKENVVRLDPSVPDGLFALDKVSTDELIGKAAHFSRHLGPKFESMFLNHTAMKYTPLYSYDNGGENG